MAAVTLAQRMEQIVRVYIQACNDGDAGAIAACFSPDAIHHMPVNDRGLESWRGASEIAARFEALVKASDRSWTVDQLISDADRHVAILEWTSLTRERDRLVRGVDWFDFEPKTLRIKAAPLSRWFQIRRRRGSNSRISTMPAGAIRQADN